MQTARPVAVALAVSLVLLTAPQVPSLDRPSWTPGDSWTYATNTTLTPGLNLTGTVVSSVQGRVTAVEGGSSVDLYQVLLSGSGTAAGSVATSSGPITVQGTWILTGEERFEPTNLDPVYNLLDLTVNGTYQGFLPFLIRVQNTTTFQIVSESWGYPLLAGTNGTIGVAYNFTQDSSITGPTTASVHAAGTGDWTENVSMDGPISVDTPLGAFSAFPITETWPDGSREVAFASPSVGNNVRTESYAPNGNLTAVTVLTAYRYQALEPPTYLGLTAIQWAVVAPAVAAALVAGLLYRRYRRKKKGQRPADLTSGPRGP